MKIGIPCLSLEIGGKETKKTSTPSIEHRQNRYGPCTCIHSYRSCDRASMTHRLPNDAPSSDPRVSRRNRHRGTAAAVPCAGGTGSDLGHYSAPCHGTDKRPIACRGQPCARRQAGCSVVSIGQGQHGRQAHTHCTKLFVGSPTQIIDLWPWSLLS